jgi:Kef-type K+ transport system membrane component KefB
VASRNQHDSVDILRKGAIVGLLFGIVYLLHRFSVDNVPFEAQGMVALGFVILAAFTIGELSEVIKLPHITGYLLTGVVLGPSMAEQLSHVLPEHWLVAPFDHGIITPAIRDQLGLLDALALALIALTAGGELKIGDLREGAAQILGILAGQTLTIGLACCALAVAISGAIPALALEQLGTLTVPQALAVGAVLGSIALATSPAATIAVINSTGARGKPMASNILSVVVLKDVVVVVAFSAAVAVATTVLGETAEASFADSLLHIGASVVLGAGAGYLLHLYLSRVGAEVLLFLVGAIYTVTYAATWIHAEPALVFIVAGFVVGNFSDRGETLIHEVERLAVPVYVVFFTLAGAKLHLDVLATMLPFAIALVVVRGLALVVGVRAGAVLTRADENTARFGWMGFISQAGLAITLASDVSKTFSAPLGEGLFSLVLAGVAINEIVGPIALQLGLGFAKERAEDQTDEPDVEPTPAAAPADLEKWIAATPPAKWPGSLGSQSPQLNTLVAELEEELQRLAHDLEVNPYAKHGVDLRRLIRQLRHEYLRFHLHVRMRILTEGSHAATVSLQRADLTDLGGRWRDLALDRAAVLNKAGAWSPMAISKALDSLVTGLPEHLRAPVEDHSLAHAEGPWYRETLRSAWRARAAISPLTREINVRDLARYHFSGLAPGRIESVAAVLYNSELYIAARIASLFDEIAAAYGKELPAEGALERIDTRRGSVEEAFGDLAHEVVRIEADATQRTISSLVATLHALGSDLLSIGSVDLPHRRRRYSRVFRERARALTKLSTGYAATRKTAGARYQALALELELAGLEGRSLDALSVHGGQLARLLHGRGTTQLDRASRAVLEATPKIEAALEHPGGAHEVLSAVDAELSPLHHTLSDALTSAKVLTDRLADEAYAAPLTDALSHAAGTLTEYYRVPAARPSIGSWRLPDRTSTVELPFRETALLFIDSEITRALLELTRGLHARVGGVVGALADLERVVAFNRELAVAELEVLGEGVVPEATRELVHELLIGAVARSHARLRSASKEVAPLAAEAPAALEAAVIGRFDTFREHVLNGNLSAIRRSWTTGGVGTALSARAGAVGGFFAATQGRMSNTVRSALGPDRLADLRRALGLQDVGGADPSLAPPSHRVELPIVYTRLFSDAAVEAGDLLTGRQTELAAAKATLLNTAPAALRSIALVGIDETSVRSVANAALRSIEPSVVHRIQLDEPTNREHLEEILNDPVPGQAVVLNGLQWCFELRPGGLEPLRTLARLMIEHAGTTSWILTADPTVWHVAVRAAPLGEAVGQVIMLRSLTPEELAFAILTRHAMSGYGLEFLPSDDIGLQLQLFLARGSEAEERTQAAWFRTLHHASGGVLHDALRLWKASIEQVDDDKGVMRLGNVPRPPISRLRDLEDPITLALLQALRQGWLSADVHASLFGTDCERAAATLASLAHRGLLTRSASGRYEVARHLRAPIRQLLLDRGWVA